MGEEATERPATDDEIEEMRRILKQGMKDGALGFATSRAGTHVGYEGRPVPSRACEIEEIFRLAKAVGEAGGGLIEATAGKDLSSTSIPTLHGRADARFLGQRSWRALHSARVTMRNNSRSQKRLWLKVNRVFPQVTPRPLNFEYQMAAPFLFEPFSIMKSVAAADTDGKKNIYADPEFRKAFADRIEGARHEFKGAFAKTVISQHKKDGELDERTWQMSLVNEVHRLLNLCWTSH